MPIKEYEFDYFSGEASVTFKVDTAIFTPDLAQATLDFFTWDYDEEADPVDEVMKKYAIRAIQFATYNNHNETGVIRDFSDAEGFANVDGSCGITLLLVDGYEFSENYLELKVKEVPNE